MVKPRRSVPAASPAPATSSADTSYRLPGIEKPVRDRLPCPAVASNPATPSPAPTTSRALSTSVVQAWRSVGSSGVGPAGSVFLIVALAEEMPILVPEDGLLSRMMTVSLSSSKVSSSTVTETIFSVSPAAKVSVPLSAS